MVSKTKTIVVLLGFSLIVILCMGAVEKYTIEDHFRKTSAYQVKLSGEHVAGIVADLNVSVEDQETSQEIAEWVSYNTGMRILVTNIDNTIISDSLGEENFVGKRIESETLKSTIETGEVQSFDLPLLGKDEVAVSVPWQTGDDISGALLIVSPLKAFARDAMNQLTPFIIKSGLGALLVATIISVLLTTKLHYSDHTSVNQLVSVECQVSEHKPEENAQSEAKDPTTEHHKANGDQKEHDSV